MTIKERPEYGSLSSAEIMELLISHEELEEKKESESDLNSLENLALDDEAEILPDYEGSVDEEFKNSNSITRELELLSERVNSLRQKNMYQGMSLEDNYMLSSGPKPPCDISCFKCKRFRHFYLRLPYVGY